MTDTETSAAQESEAAEPTRLGGRGMLSWLVPALLVVSADQYTKYLVTENLTLYQRVPVLPFFDLVRLHNTGAAFSFLAGESGWQNLLFLGVAAVVSLGIVWWLWTLPAKGRVTLALGLALVLGGAIGNVIDRLSFGYVVDFLLFFYRDWSYPAFNIADSAITVGVILVLFDGVVLEKRRAVPSD